MLYNKATCKQKIQNYLSICLTIESISIIFHQSVLSTSPRGDTDETGHYEGNINQAYSQESKSSSNLQKRSLSDSDSDLGGPPQPMPRLRADEIGEDQLYDVPVHRNVRFPSGNDCTKICRYKLIL